MQVTIKPNKMPIKLTQQENIVLEVVREYLDKNRYFNMKKILSFLNFRFKMAKINISNAGIEKILQSLVEKNILVDGSKLIRDDVLLNEKRRRIYHFVIENPGVYFNRIINELNLSNHVVVWHLEILMKFNLIIRGEYKNHEVYYPPDVKFEEVKRNYVYSSTKSKQIVKFLRKDNNGYTKTYLSEQLSMHPNTIKKYLNSLEEYNIVNRKKVGKKSHYFLNEKYLD